METINEYQTEEQTDGEFQLTADVFTDVEIFSEIPSEVEPEVVESGIEEQSVETDLFVFEPAEDVIVEGLQAEGELTPFEQQTIDAMLTGNFQPFDALYANADGSINMDLWWGSCWLYNDLVANGIAPEDYAATATAWLLA